MVYFFEGFGEYGNKESWFLIVVGGYWEVELLSN